MDVTDEDLALAAAAGDRAAFGALLNRVYDRMFGLAYRLTGSRTEAEDLVQDVCADLAAKLQTYHGRARVTTWIYRVVVNAAQDRRRRAGAHARAAAGWGEVELARRAEMDEAAGRMDWLTRAMAALPDDIRDTLALVLDDMSHAQAAEVLDVAEGTVSWRVSRARQMLRTMKEAEA